MKTFNVIALILVSLIFLTTLLIVLFKFFTEKIENILNKVDTSENESFEKLKVKYNLIIRCIKLIENKFKIESKTFEDVKKVKIDSISSFKHDKLLNKCYSEILQIKEDNQKSKDVKSFKDIIEEYEENELHIISLRTYYNKYTLEFNNLIKKFPYNIVSKTRRYKLKTLFEGKELDSNFNNDLEV
jgi:hypothetical protein